MAITAKHCCQTSCDYCRTTLIEFLGRLPDRPRDRPGRDGDRLRGRQGSLNRHVALEVSVALWPERRRCTVPPRGPGRRAAAPHQHRAGLRRRRATTACIIYVMQYIDGRGLDGVRRAAAAAGPATARGRRSREVGADRPPGGRGPGLRPRPGGDPPRHQALEPAARRPTASSGSPTSAWPRSTTDART